ncbi:MAG: hypothetical protein DWP97_00095 [Calditrichaeota bacterium]|nr:MAG: hypothetical protein DWP97_00095 [Calditrichota bacterium]
MQKTIPEIPEPLTVWEKVEIYTSDDETKGIYISRIEDFIDEKIVIAHPDFIDGHTRLQNLNEVLIWVTKSDAIYQFVATIEKIENDSKSRYVLSNPKFIRRIQRREFVRVRISDIIEYLPVMEGTSVENGQWRKSLFQDLSGSGVLCEVSPDITEGTYLLLRSVIFSKLGIKQPVLARVCRIEKVNNGCFAGIEFIRKDVFENISSSVSEKIKTITENNFDFLMQERLVSFVFHHQVELRKKGIM